jgi:hypothetical protein
MDNLIAIELRNDEHHDIIEPFLSISSSFKDQYGPYYIFSSIEDVLTLENELADFAIIEAVHSLYLLNQPTLYQDFQDYGFSSKSKNYLFRNMVKGFSITSGENMDIKMALLQFNEHLIASDDTIYLVDHHHQGLIEKIANSYNIKIHFFELDK